MYEHRGQLRFSDSDAMGHVNHARFATLFEDARIAMLRHEAGTADLPARGMILARLEIDYLRPMLVDAEPVVVRTSVGRIGTSSFDIDYELIQHDATCARGHTVLVAYDYAAGRSRPLTETERVRLMSLREVPPAG